MEENFWLKKWENNEIGFHSNKTHPLLSKHINKLELASGSTIFLPLCGKTLDITYLLSLGHSIVGSELSETAIKQLFQELDITPNISNTGEFILYQAENIDIFVGDFFQLNSAIFDENNIRKIDATYDRASFIALPLAMRQRYTKHLAKISHSARQLLISLLYEQNEKNTPPFSIEDKEIYTHYETYYSTIQCIEKHNSNVKDCIRVLEKAWILHT